MTTLNDSPQMPLNFTALITDAPKPKALNEKAMSVQLVTRKPTTRHNDEEAAKVARSALGDDGIGASTTLFKDKHNPLRHLLNEVSAAYAYHKANTLPYIDRGPRLLPVSRYEPYRDAMRQLIGDIETRKASVMQHYDKHVLDDCAYRNATATVLGKAGRASPADYPTAYDFGAGISLDFRFAPLPDNSHWLFDVSDEDKEALRAQTTEVYNAALADMKARIVKPLEELAAALAVSPGVDATTGQRIGIFRDTKVTNVTEAVARVRDLSMGDEDVLAACDAVSAVLPKAIVENIDILRESPVVREAAAKRLAEVASRMGAFFGG
jgi:hypothetical protein